MLVYQWKMSLIIRSGIKPITTYYLLSREYHSGVYGHVIFFFIIHVLYALCVRSCFNLCTWWEKRRGQYWCVFTQPRSEVKRKIWYWERIHVWMVEHSLWINLTLINQGIATRMARCRMKYFKNKAYEIFFWTFHFLSLWFFRLFFYIL